MSEELAAYEVPNGMGDGRGVERRMPPVPNGHFRSRSLLPSTWLNQVIEVTTTDGDSVRGRLLDFCVTGPVLLTRLSPSEAARRVVAWEVIKYVDLVEKSGGGAIR